MAKVVLGFAGNFAAGKGEAVKYLVEKHSFYASSCSDRIREELIRQGKEITRETLHPMAGELRQKYGPTVLVERTWHHILEKGAQKAIIDSIMSGEEVEFLRKVPDFHLIWVDADQRMRFERMLARKRGDPTTWEEFVASEERNQKGDGRSLLACREEADFKIDNSGTLEDLHQKLDAILQKIGVE